MKLMHGIAVLFVLLPLAGCEKSPVNRYASRAQADAAGAIDRGWVPDFIPENASSIIETHSVDANQARVEFTVPAKDYAGLVARARFVPLPKSFDRAVAKAIDMPSWSSLGKGNLQPVARCNGGEGNGLGLINRETGRVHYVEPVHLPGVCSRENPD